MPSRRAVLGGFASVGLVRAARAAEIRAVPVRENGIVGTLFLPACPSDRPAVLCLTGAMGGLWEAPAAALAREGFAALALATHNFENLPPRLRLLPLDTIARAVDWLRLRAAPRNDIVAVRGWSRGGEAALLLASLTSTVNAVIAYAPRCYVGREQDKPNNFNDPNAAAAWTWQGAPAHGTALPFEMLANRAHQSLEDMFGIAVERIKGPVMLVSGGADTGLAGTTAQFGCDTVMRRLELFKSPYQRAHWSYQDAGHFIAGPPSFSGPVEDGGTLAGDRVAIADSWPRAVQFLNDIAI